MSSQKGARSKLADVLADIKNSRAEDDLDCSSQDVAPTPAKRRSAVNYKVLSGQAPRQSRSSTASNSSVINPISNHNHHHETRSTTTNTESAQQQTLRQRSYVLKLYDRAIDLAEFINTDEGDAVDVPLYPVCRSWVHGQPKSQAPHKPAASPNCVPQQESAASGQLEVVTMPPPLTKAEVLQSLNLPAQEESVDIRVPDSVRNFVKPENTDSIQSMERDECLELNKQRWRKVREEWSSARRIHEARYAKSFKILQDMVMVSSRAV